MTRRQLHSVAGVTIALGVVFVWCGSSVIGMAVQVAALPLFIATSSLFAQKTPKSAQKPVTSAKTQQNQSVPLAQMDRAQDS